MLIEYLPAWLAVWIPEFSLLLAGIAVERHYVGRITTFTNSMALLVHLLTVGAGRGLFTLYVEIGVVLGLIGFVAYVERETLPTIYYEISYVCYSSVVVASAMLFPHTKTLLGIILPSDFPVTDPHLVALFLIGFVVVMHIVLLVDGDGDIYTLSRPAVVNEFINEWKVRVPVRGGTKMVSLDNWFDYK